MSPALSINVFTAPEKAVVGERPRPFGPPIAFDPMTSTLIFGENDAVLVDTLTTVAEAEALANWVALHHRHLTTIYITHGHIDHFAGLSVLLQRFPEARAIATPRSVELMRRQSLRLRGEFLERAANVLAFGLPGVGKSHAACAIGHALVEAGHSVLFSPTYLLVQELLAAKRDLELPRALRKLDAFDLIILDDIGYVQQSADEIEVLFTLMAERYERRSMLITSNLVFSAWDQILKNPMTTAAAIDRLVHHSVILEFAVPSYRSEKAEKARKNGATDDNYTKSAKSKEK